MNKLEKDIQEIKEDIKAIKRAVLIPSEDETDYIGWGVSYMKKFDLKEMGIDNWNEKSGFNPPKKRTKRDIWLGIDIITV